MSLSREPTGNDSFIPYYRPKRPKIALALSGGGARGFAQIGVLKVIERYGLPIDGIAGTSMGAIIGGLLSVGYSASEIEEISNQIRWEDIIQDTPPRKQLFLGQKEERDRHIIQLRFDGLSFHIPSAYTAGQHLTTMLTDIILKAPQPIKSNFDHLYIPLRVIATDLLTGTGVILKGGSLIDALRASMAIPLLFTPVQIDNAVLVDGGLVRNLPVTEAKNFGTDLIIAIDTSSKLRAIESLTAPWQIADQVTTIMQQSETISQLDSADIVIQPNLDNISNTDFGKIDTIIKEGEIAAEKIISQIYAYFMNNISPTPDSFLTFNRIEISGCQHLDPEKFLQKIKIPLSSPVPISHIIQAGQSLYQTGYFQKVAAFVDTSTLSLTFKVDENPPIQSITIIGNHIFSDSLLLENFETIPGEVLNFHKGRLDYRRLIETYRQSGYVLASIDSVRIIEDELQIYLWEGLIENIQLSGNNKTHPFVILRELPIKEGDTFSVTSLRKGIDNIYSTGYFEGVRFHLERKGHSQDLIIHVIERANTLIQAGYRYDLERYSKGFLQIVEENLLGLGSKGSFMGLLGDREKLIRARLWSDRFRNTYLTYQFSFSTGKHWYPFYENGAHTGTYNKSITEGSIKIGHHMRRFGTLSAEFRSEKIKLNPISGDNTPSDQFHLLSLIVKSEIDTRDRLPLPRTGKYHTLEYEYSGGILGGDVSYFKIFSTMESYYRLNSSFIFHPRISWGTADLRTPFPKHYRLGGLNSFIGLPEEAFTGRRYIIINGEIRYKIPWPRWLESYIAIRYDLGGIWNRYVKISSKDFKQGIGTIFSVMSPFGPIHLGYGHMSDGTSQFYLSAGFQF